MDAGPAEFLGLFQNAAYVVTNSFHGTVFSAIFQTDFEVFRRDREDDPASRNSRIDNLLRQLELDSDLAEIPWEAVTTHLAEMRREGLAYLASLLEEQR